MRKSQKPYTAFGATVGSALTASNLSQAVLATGMKTTSAQVTHLLRGYRKPSPKWVDLIADTLDMSEDERRDLHLKAARQYGFKL